MAQSADGDRKDPSQAGRDASESRGRRRRTRPLLNLGIPLRQVDDFLNQSEDAVALGYRVLEDTVEEIKKGYAQAQKFNREQKAFETGHGPAPAVPWEELVERVQGLQNIALRTIKTSTDIFFESIKSGTKAMRSTAKMVEQSSDDLEAKPQLAGPVFEELLKIRVTAGQPPARPHRWEIQHASLTRLRIQAIVPAPGLRRLQEPDPRSAPPTLKVKSVSFAPTEKDPNESSELVLEMGAIARTPAPGDYEGIVKAANFELLIARLRVTVDRASHPSDAVTARVRKGRATPEPKLSK